MQPAINKANYSLSSIGVNMNLVQAEEQNSTAGLSSAGWT